jgi:hypothetical protein
VGALQAVGAHEPLHPLAPDPYALAAQLQPHPRGAVGGRELVPGADLEDLLQQDGVVELATARRDLPSAPVVVGGLGDTQDPQNETGREVMRVDEAHDHLRVEPISAAK